MDGKRKEKVLISVEDAREIVKTQVESYRHTQTQAQRTIRILVAVLPIIVTVIVATDGNLIPTPPENGISPIGPFSTETVRTTIYVNYLILILLFMASLLFAVFGVSQIASLLSPSQLHPGLGSNDEYFEVIANDVNIKSKYEKWILNNERTLSQKRETLNYGQKNLVISLVVILYIVVMIFHLSDPLIMFAIAMNIAFVLVGVATISALAIKSAKRYKVNNNGRIRDAFKHELGSYRQKITDTESLKFPFPYFLIFTFLMTLIVILSGFILYYWVLDLYKTLSEVVMNIIPYFLF